MQASIFPKVYPMTIRILGFGELLKSLELMITTTLKAFKRSAPASCASRDPSPFHHSLQGTSYTFFFPGSSCKNLPSLVLPNRSSNHYYWLGNRSPFECNNQLNKRTSWIDFINKPQRNNIQFVRFSSSSNDSPLKTNQVLVASSCMSKIHPSIQCIYSTSRVLLMKYIRFIFDPLFLTI